jgi:hypothetical protein
MLTEPTATLINIDQHLWKYELAALKLEVVVSRVLEQTEIRFQRLRLYFPG